jgi:hypothetical protein
MNRIVRENYPVDRLPEDLRDQLPGRQRVTLTIDWSPESFGTEACEQPDRVKSLDELFAMAEPTFKSLDEVTAHIRSLRDEWS